MTSAVALFSSLFGSASADAPAECAFRLEESKGELTHPVQSVEPTKDGRFLNYTVEATEPVRAVGCGTVKNVTFLTGFGQSLILSHGEGLQTVYGGLSRTQVRTGQVVEAGQVIALVDPEGRHDALIFGIWANGDAVNPAEWVAPFPVEEASRSIQGGAR